MLKPCTSCVKHKVCRFSEDVQKIVNQVQPSLLDEFQEKHGTDHPFKITVDCKEFQQRYQQYRNEVREEILNG